MILSNCPYCGAELAAPSERGGRPRRWCSDGCALAGEAAMRRANAMIRRLTEQANFVRLGGNEPRQRVTELLAEWQAEYDRLAGVPKAQRPC